MKVVPDCQIQGLGEIYDKYFGDTVGTFVEVGAHDGKSYSNTYELAKAGWIGFYIEPISHMAQACRNNHEGHDVIVVEQAVSNYNGKLALYKGADIYTANKNVLPVNEELLVTCTTLDKFLDVNNFEEGEGPDVLVIDVEFHEKEVLEGFTLERWKPKMVIIEAHEHHENDKFKLNAKFINDYFSSYEKIYSDGINNIYVR